MTMTRSNSGMGTLRTTKRSIYAQRSAELA